MLEAVKRESIYQPLQPGLKFPQKPTFATHAEERHHRQQRLVAACRAFAVHGLDYGFAGHLTIRDPERPELYWTNPMAVHFARLMAYSPCTTRPLWSARIRLLIFTCAKCTAIGLVQ